MLSLQLLSTFVLVADRQSFSAAADEHNVAKGVVSKRIAQLEAHLGHSLFRRTTRRVDLTPAGEVYLEVARKVMLDLEAGNEALTSLRSAPSGVIRMTAPIAWGTRILAKLMPEYLRLYPKMEVELLLLDRRMDLANERIDIALRMTDAPQPDEVAIPLAEVERVLCASSRYIDAHGMPRTPPELTQHSCLGYWHENSNEYWNFSRKNDATKVKIGGRYRVNSPEAVRDAVMADVGIGMLPRYVCDAELASGELVRVLPSWQLQTPFGTKIYAVGLPERIRLARCQHMLDFLKQALGKNSPRKKNAKKLLL